MTELIRWNPFQEVSHGHSDIDDLFNRFFSFPPRDRGQRAPVSWAPSMETFQKDGRCVVRLDLPGLDPKDIEVSVENRSLIVKGERKKTEEMQEQNYHYRETAYGRFERHFVLPRNMDANKVTARYENGVLVVSMPLPEHLARKKVSIQIEGSNGERSTAA